MYGLAELVIVPGILLGVFLVFLGILAARITGKYLQVLEAKRAWHNEPRQRIAVLSALCKKQSDVIDAIIASPASCGTLPQDVQDAVYAAHDTARKEMQ